jgi:hypothetical protein
MIQYHFYKKSNDKKIDGMTLGDFLDAKKAGVFDEKVDYENSPFFLRYK